jgi:hypothetical protein
MCVYIKQLRTILKEETGEMNGMRRATNEKEEEEDKRNAITRKRERE